MAHENQNTQTNLKDTRLPESITIGETTFVIKDTPELMSLIGSISQIEKSKLYTKIEALKAEMNRLEKVQVQPTEPLDISGLKEEIMAEMRDLIQPLIDKTQKIEKNSVEEYREKVIAENADTCFPEMVKGNTIEEINASLLESKNLRAKYPTASPANNGSAHVTDPLLQQQMAAVITAPANAPQVAAPINSNQAPQKAAPIVPSFPAGEPSRTDISSLTPDEFAKRRDSLRQEIKSLV